MKVSQLWRELNSDVSVVLFIIHQFVQRRRKLLQRTSLQLSFLVSTAEEQVNIAQVFSRNVYICEDKGFCPFRKHSVAQCGSMGSPFNSVVLILHQICLYPPYGGEEPWMKGWLSRDPSPTGESDTLTYKHTTICDQCLWAIASARAAGMLNGDRG